MNAQPPIRFIDLARQYEQLKPEVDAAIHRVLDHGQYIMGPEIAQLETRLADYVGVEHCIGVASGTEALLIALMALDIGPGDEVITTPFTFIATAEVIALLGATPVLVDIDASCNVDPALIEAAITDRTRAIMPVALYGQCADMAAINEIAARHGNIPVIEDAAQSFGATFSGDKSCGVSTIGCTSFFPSKPLGCYGDGGAIFTRDAKLATAMREIRVHGQERRYYHTRIGVGGRLDTIQAAILLAKMDTFEEEVRARVAIGDKYRARLRDIPGIDLPLLRQGDDCVWAQLTILTDERDALAKHLNEAGVPTAIHYPVPLHHQPAYRDLCRLPAPVPHAESAARRVLSLPMHPYLSDAEIDHIVETVERFQKA
ncbi:UDP-2-acetamido-2-deoxy-ribo-hexuluronate aminotransferase [Sphingopyxis sp. YR583]|uniref:DegT/DnrJ/EryC1/StrS family aminotransferase n=1 Tax=Sphingopyxis sp. YR583 TaxID=1881047 RepID=UPI0008A7CF0C|nr:DegT/DnrJ/EryC1/StrS family aminotransferase [Sphingopyxis sp. YR583]SEH18291.1 UDP-2-acetamido-2-deoxy-ribo-hexuluronate aminotransferase [Sphingopyxis sp. YR583]